MSVEGIFVLSSITPPLGAKVAIEIAKPEHFGKLQSLVKARMTVLRIDRELDNGGTAGFAAHGKVFTGRSGKRKGARGEIKGPFVGMKSRRFGNRLEIAGSCTGVKEQ